jgi:hypothetical protein
LAAFGGLLSYPPQSASAENTIESAQRAYEPAIKTRYRQVQKKGGKKYRSRKPGPFIMPLRCGNEMKGRVRKREKQEVYRAIYQGNRVQQSGHERGGNGSVKL